MRDVHGRFGAERREEMGQRIDGLGPQHAFVHGVAQVLGDLVRGAVASLGEVPPPEHRGTVDQHDLPVGLVGARSLEVDLAVGPEERPRTCAGVAGPAPQQGSHLGDHFLVHGAEEVPLVPEVVVERARVSPACSAISSVRVPWNPSRVKSRRAVSSSARRVSRTWAARRPAAADAGAPSLPASVWSASVRFTMYPTYRLFGMCASRHRLLRAPTTGPLRPASTPRPGQPSPARPVPAQE